MENKRKLIEIGKFYYLHDGTKTGHPCFVVEKDDDKNRYLVIRFDSDKYGEISKEKRGIKHITKLSIPTEKNIKTSYVRNRPMICKRKDIGKELIGLAVAKEDYSIINQVSKRNPEKSPSFRK